MVFTLNCILHAKYEQGTGAITDPEELKKLAEKMRDDVASAVAAGLKRKAEDGNGGAGGAAGAGAGKKAAEPSAKRSKGLFDAVLGELSEDDSEEEEEA